MPGPETTFMYNLNRLGIRSGDRILAGISGGRDSVVLFHLLLKAKEEMGIDFGVAHINHQLRGKGSLKDERFVSALAKRYGLPCYILRTDVRAKAKEGHLSIEEAARRERYDFMERTRAEEGYLSIAVAHHKRDQAETVLMHLLRGSGLRGLKAMELQRDRIIRPMLPIEHKAIIAYAKEHRLAYRVDLSNFSTLYTRNRVRHILLPMLKRFNPQVEGALVRLASIAGEDNLYLEQITNEKYALLTKEENHRVRISSAFLLEHRSIRNRLLLKAYRQLTGGHLEHRYLEEIGDCMKDPTRRKLGLPGKVSIYLGEEEVILEKPLAPSETFEILVSEPGHYRIGKKTMLLEVFDAPPSKERYSRRGTPEGYGDLSSITFPLTIRNRRSGDTFQVIGEPSPRNLGDLLISRKIDREKRLDLPILTDAQGTILFIPEIGISEPFKIREDTGKILHIYYS